MSLSSRMYREAAQAADVVREQLQTNAAGAARIGALLRDMKPRAVVTCARGSSDNAATFAKYLIESHAKVLTSSAAPSLSSLYEALERTGNRPVRALQRLRAVLFTAEQAKLLKAQANDAGLLVERLGFLKDGRAVEFSQSYYRGDIYDFVAELSATS